METLQEIVGAYFGAGTRRAVLSNPVSGAAYKKIVISARDGYMQLEKFTEKQVFHENLTFEQARTFVLSALEGEYKQFNAWDEQWEYSLRISKKDKLLHGRRAAGTAAPVQPSHNREKQYILREGVRVEPLVDMGIYTKEGKVVNAMRHKFRQINRFIEIIDDEMDRFEDREELTVLDFGCGKSYLTFVLYYYFTVIRKKKVRMTGVDLKADVMEKCQEAACKYGYTGLTFRAGDIRDFVPEGKVDILITLHACDTATDHALYNAVRWGVDTIFSVPCCQHELNSQIKSDTLSIFNRYGIIQERTAALMTDALRGNLLEYCGYRTQILEFISLDETPKNLLIRAVRTTAADQKGSTPSGKRCLEEAEALMNTFHLSPTLYCLLQESGYLQQLNA